MKRIDFAEEVLDKLLGYNLDTLGRFIFLTYNAALNKYGVSSLTKLSKGDKEVNKAFEEFTKEKFNQIFSDTNGKLANETQMQKLVKLVSPIANEYIPTEKKLEPILGDRYLGEPFTFRKDSNAVEIFASGVHECLERKLQDFNKEQNTGNYYTHTYASAFTPIICNKLDQKYPDQGFDVSEIHWRHFTLGVCFNLVDVSTDQNKWDFITHHYIEACYYAFGSEPLMDFFKKNETNVSGGTIIERLTDHLKAYSENVDLNFEQTYVLNMIRLE